MAGTVTDGCTGLDMTGHQVLFVSTSFKFRLKILAAILTVLIYLVTLFAKPVEVERPVVIFQSIKEVATVLIGIKPVPG
jgi:hypothetical protein